MAVIDGKWLSKEGLTYFWSKIKAIFTKQTETNVVANLGAKNLFNINAVQTANHVTSSLSDGVLTVTSSGNWAHYSVPVNLPAGDYIFTTTISNFSRASGAAATSVRMRIATSTSGGTAPALVTVSGNGPLEIPFTWTGGHLYVQYYPNYSSTATYVSSFTASNSMIRRAEITDCTFQKYSPTNEELYETRFASKTILPDNVDLNDIKTGGIYNGVNSTGNSAVHMPVATGSFNFVLTVIEANEFVIQIFKQLNSAGDPNLYIRRFYIYNSDWDSWYQFTGTQV